jgi:hypothetical protein
VAVLPAGLDWGHVVLAALLVVVVLARLRTRHRRRFDLTVVVRRDAADSAESNVKGPLTDDSPSRDD